VANDACEALHRDHHRRVWALVRRWESSPERATWVAAVSLASLHIG
jgi:hypothetical protein